MSRSNTGQRVCLNVGCIPSKALLRNAKLVVTKPRSTASPAAQAVAFDRSRKVAEERAKGVHYPMRKNAITEIDGHGTFIDAHAVHVALATGEEATPPFDNAIIATGSEVRLISGVHLSENVVTYESQILARELPESGLGALKPPRGDGTAHPDAWGQAWQFPACALCGVLPPACIAGRRPLACALPEIRGSSEFPQLVRGSP